MIKMYKTIGLVHSYHIFQDSSILTRANSWSYYGIYLQSRCRQNHIFHTLLIRVKMGCSLKVRWYHFWDEVVRKIESVRVAWLTMDFDDIILYKIHRKTANTVWSNKDFVRYYSIPILPNSHWRKHFKGKRLFCLKY